MTPKTYSTEFKNEICHLILNCNRRASDLANQHNIYKETIQRWLTQYRKKHPVNNLISAYAVAEIIGVRYWTFIRTRKKVTPAFPFPYLKSPFMFKKDDVMTYLENNVGIKGKMNFIFSQNEKEKYHKKNYLELRNYRNQTTLRKSS